MSQLPLPPLPSAVSSAVQPAWRLLDPTESATEPSGWAELDTLLGGGLPRADLIELISAGPGDGSWSLALALAERLRAGADEELRQQAIMVFDPDPGRLTPTERWPQQTVWVRTPTRGAGGLLERALRCAGVAACVGPLARGGLKLTARLRRAARAGRSPAILIRPRQARDAASAAGLRLAVRRLTPPGAGEALEVEALRVRGYPGEGRRARLELER